MKIDPSEVVIADRINPDEVEIAQAPTNTIGQEAKRQGGLFLRQALSAAGSVGAIPADAIGKAVNYVAGREVVPNQQRALQQAITRMGVPEPERPIEKFGQGMAESAPAFALPAGIVPQVLGNAAIGATQAPAGSEGSGAAWGAAGGAAVPVLGQSLAALGRGSQHVLGHTTGAGRESVRQAFRDAPGFVENMRGDVEPGTVVAQARRGLDNMRQTMYDNYANAKGGWAADTTPMSLNPVEQAFSNVDRRFSFRGIPQPGVEGVRQQTRAVLDQWADNASRDPSFLTVEGLDALKRHLATITPGDVENRAGRAFVTELVDSVRQSIIAQRPEYRAAMQDYFNRSEQLDEIGRSLSLGNRATTDTALRKLQSVVRNNVNANFGQRLRSANDLAQQGGEDILPAISGQALSSLTPRGIQSTVASGAGLGSLINPALLATLPAFSPRAVGETARATGNIVRDPRTQAFIEAMRRGSGSAVRNMREQD